MKWKRLTKTIFCLLFLAQVVIGDDALLTTDNTNVTVKLNDNTTIISRQSGQIRFEDNDQSQYLSSYDEESDFGVSVQGQPFKFEDDNDYNLNQDERVTFEEENRTEEPVKKKRRRRRRRPRYQGLPNSGYPQAPGYNHLPNPYQPVLQQYAPGNVPLQGYPGYGQPNSGYGLLGSYPGQFRPSRRPQSSVASDALSSVTKALTSIALYDDYQCVPRLLCEAAGGGNLGSSGLLQSVSGLQQLLTMLSAYSGLSGSPLFVFGRAVFIGMSNKGNSGPCRETYPQCPSDPERLIHYLNNHNGGFCRFFNAPHLQRPQSIKQFYNQLSIPGQQHNFGQSQNNQPVPQPNPYDLLNPQANQGVAPYPSYSPYYPFNLDHQHYAYYNPMPNKFYQQYHNYGLYNQQNHGMLNYNQNPNKYQLNYGAGYPHQGYSYRNNAGNQTDHIQRRIQVKSNYEYIDAHKNTVENQKLVFSNRIRLETKNFNDARHEKKLRFPDESIQIHNYDNNRNKKALVFPEQENHNLNRFFFPDSYVANTDTDNSIDYQNNVENYEQGLFNDIDNGIIHDYSRDYNYGGDSNVKNHVNQVNEDVHTVYVVRGYGNPNKPEIVHLKPGEKLTL